MAELRSRPLRLANGWAEDASRLQRTERLCGPCVTWLAAIVGDVRNGGGANGLAGQPTPGARALMFEDQCSLCHTMPGETGNIVQCVATAPGRRSWAPMFACPSCDLWLAGLAQDGRSARGEEDRLIDGPYGDWPHPNLRDLSVALLVADAAARAAILEATSAMGVDIVTRPDVRTLFFVEAGAGFEKASVDSGNGAARRVLLAPLTARDQLRALLVGGAAAWLTIPLTPQQVTAALTFAMRQRGLRLQWDLETALPVADPHGSGREAVLCTPAGTTDRFELAWLLKRFSRGYDDVVMANGEILLLPRATASSLDSVIGRLEKLLGGRCRFESFDTGLRTRRFDVAG